MQSNKADKGSGLGSVRGGKATDFGRIFILWGFLALALAVLAIPSSADLENSGTFEAWINSSSLQNGTVWSICRIQQDSSYMRKCRIQGIRDLLRQSLNIPVRNSHMHSVDKGVVLQMAFDNSSSVGEGYGGAEIDESGETGLVGYWKFNNDSAVGEDYNGTNASLVYDYSGSWNHGTNDKE